MSDAQLVDGTEASTVNLLRDPRNSISHAGQGKCAVRKGADHGVVILTGFGCEAGDRACKSNANGTQANWSRQ